MEVIGAYVGVSPFIAALVIGLIMLAFRIWQGAFVFAVGVGLITFIVAAFMGVLNEARIFFPAFGFLLVFIWGFTLYFWRRWEWTNATT